MAKTEMTPDEQKAHRLAEALAPHDMPDHSPLHAGIKAARTRQDALLVARVAALAGVSLDDLIATQEAASAAADAVMRKAPADA